MQVRYSLSNALIVARLAVVCTQARLYARALASFWFVHAAIDEALQKHADLPGPAIWPVTAYASCCTPDYAVGSHTFATVALAVEYLTSVPCTLLQLCWRLRYMSTFHCSAPVLILYTLVFAKVYHGQLVSI